MKKQILISLLFLVVLLSSSANAKSDNKQENYKYRYENCDEWDNWKFCERGHFHEYLIIDNQGKGHLIFKNIGQWWVFLDNQLIWKGVDHDTISANSKEELPAYWVTNDFDNYIFKDLDYEINETTLCTNYRFIKITNDETTFNRSITNCYPK